VTRSPNTRGWQACEGCPNARRRLPGSGQSARPGAWNSKLIRVLGNGLELELGEIITEMLKPESIAVLVARKSLCFWGSWLITGLCGYMQPISIVSQGTDVAGFW
jgi:hypothetical protein